MTIPDEVEQAAREPTDAELAVDEAMVERARQKLRWLGYQVSHTNARAALEAALSGEEE